eukprot:CCRYP_002381-RC/>CCRYP_002381-RC protein AED:0.05 eAED:0.05 QI:297/1/1/1/0.66/0.5/4/326/301
MVSFRSSLLLPCFLATTSYALAITPNAQSPAFTRRSNAPPSASRVMMMSGGSTATPDLKAPAAIYDGAVAAGAAKASASWAKVFKLGIAAGCHIGFGSYLAITVGGACPQLAEANPGLQKIIFGAFGLPFGLIMTLVTGGELFTGNTALVTAAVMEGKTTKADLVKNWVSSYAGNLVGSLFLAYLAYKSGTLGNAPASKFNVHSHVARMISKSNQSSSFTGVAIATAKCSLPFETAFVRGILCNWLVCMAVYMASGCASLAGKMVAVWFPISAFVALGLDHSVANMFIVSYVRIKLICTET